MVSRLLGTPLRPPVSIGTAVEGPPWMFMAGMSSASESYPRVVGSTSKISRSIVSLCRTLWTSMVGVASVTVTVSESAPTASSPSTFAVNPVLSVMPSRTSVLTPGSVNVTV